MKTSLERERERERDECGVTHPGISWKWIPWTNYPKTLKHHRKKWEEQSIVLMTPNWYPRGALRKIFWKCIKGKCTVLVFS